MSHDSDQDTITDTMIKMMNEISRLKSQLAIMDDMATSKDEYAVENAKLREQVRKLRGAMEWIGGVSTDHHQGQHSFRDLMVCANEALRESEEVK